MRDGKLDDHDNRQAVLRALAVGMTLADAAECAGVSARMLSKYRARNAEFDAACTAARAIAFAVPPELDAHAADPAQPAPDADTDLPEDVETEPPPAAPPPAAPPPAAPPRIEQPDYRAPKRPRAPKLLDIPILARNPWMRGLIRELDSLGGPSLRELLELTETIARDGEHRAAVKALDKLWELKFGPLMWEIRRMLEAGGPPEDTVPGVIDGDVVDDAPDTRRASGLMILRLPKNGREAPGRGPQDEPDAGDLAGEGS